MMVQASFKTIITSELYPNNLDFLVLQVEQINVTVNKYVLSYLSLLKFIFYDTLINTKSP